VYKFALKNVAKIRSDLMQVFIVVFRKSLLIFCLLAAQPSFAENVSLSQFLEEYQYVAIPLKKLLSGHDVIEAKFEGEKGVFVLDTGAISIINKPALKKYGLHMSDKLKSVEAAGAAGDIQVDFYPGKKLFLDGRFEWLPEKIASTDIRAVARAISSSTGIRIDGLIGMDLLVKFNALIDIPNRILYLQRLNGKELDTGFSDKLARYFTQKKFQLAKLKRFYLEPIDATYLAVDITINRVKGILTIDSGAGQSLLNSNNLPLFDVSKRRRSSREENYGAGGRFQVKRYSLDSYLVADREAGLKVISTADLSAVVSYVKRHSNVDMNGVLGQDYFIPRKAVIDIGNSRMFVKPVKR
jgi:hypothetical protein